MPATINCHHLPDPVLQVLLTSLARPLDMGGQSVSYHTRGPANAASLRLVLIYP